MLRQIIRTFQRSLVLQAHATTKATTTTQNNTILIRRPPVLQCQRACYYTGDADSSSDPIDGNISPFSSTNETERAYIVGYQGDREGRVSTLAMMNVLNSQFRLSAAEVRRLQNDEYAQRQHREAPMLRTLEVLVLEGVTKKSFLEYTWLLTLEKTRLQEKLNLIHTMSVRDINHFVPFLRLTVNRLRKLVHALNCESDSVPHGNRIYYISEMLQCDAALVTKYLHKRLFILEMPFEMLEQNLQHMLNYNVSSINILKDLWAFKYTPKAVELRLERAKRARKEKIMPWMVRCPEPILQRSLKLSMDELKVLGDKANTIEYLAGRLGFDVDETKAIMDKHPKVHRVRVTKIKEILDYLMIQEDFTRYEIAQVPRILCHGLETTKNRIEELKKLGCRPSSLIILCRSKREYEKFLQEWTQGRENKFNYKANDDKLPESTEKAMKV